MDPRIIDLKSTTFSGRRLNRRQIADIAENADNRIMPRSRPGALIPRAFLPPLSA